MTVAIDFDGTLVRGDEPLPGARYAVNLLRESGHRIIVYSCNRPEWIKKVLDNHDIRYDAIWGREGKPVANLYVDDRGFSFSGDWLTDLPKIMTLLGEG